MDNLEKKSVEAAVADRENVFYYSTDDAKADLSALNLPNLHTGSFLNELKRENDVLFGELVKPYANKIVPQGLTGREEIVEKMADGLLINPNLIDESGHSYAFMDYLNNLKNGPAFEQLIFWQTANYLFDKKHLTENLELPGMNFSDGLLEVALLYDLEHNKGSSVLGDPKLLPPSFKEMSYLSEKMEEVRLALELIRDDPHLQPRYHRFYNLVRGLENIMGGLENKAMDMIKAVETEKVLSAR